jgi:hypothetical protein
MVGIVEDTEIDDLMARMLHIGPVRREPSVETTEALN